MNKEKVDKGFELIYYRLSYRRRFIRTLWLSRGDGTKMSLESIFLLFRLMPRALLQLI